MHSSAVLGGLRCPLTLWCNVSSPLVAGEADDLGPATAAPPALAFPSRGALPGPLPCRAIAPAGTWGIARRPRDGCGSGMTMEEYVILVFKVQVYFIIK